MTRARKGGGGEEGSESVLSECTLSIPHVMLCSLSFRPQEFVFKSKIRLNSPKSQNSRSSVRSPRILAIRAF